MGVSKQKRKRDTIKINLVSTAGTGYFYTKKKNTKNKEVEKRTKPIVLKKYDPVANKHVLFKEKKIR